MLYWITLEQLKPGTIDKVITGEKSVYDITHKDVSMPGRRFYYQWKYLGHTVVFKFDKQHKILVVGRKRLNQR